MSALVGRIASLYQKSVGKSLAMYGLKYDDLLVETRPVQEALHWATSDEYAARTRRMARAADCSMKRTYLPDEIQNIQRPFENYLADNVAAAEELQDERDELTRW